MNKYKDYSTDALYELYYVLSFWWPGTPSPELPKVAAEIKLRKDLENEI